MNEIKTLSLEKSNDYIIKKLQSNKKFLISRMGAGAETIVVYLCTIHGIDKIYTEQFDKLFIQLSIENGIYNLTKNSLSRYVKLYKETIEKSDSLAVFINLMITQQKYFVENNKLETLYSRVLEPFYCCQDNIKPWSQHLLGKKVLIINPFVESFQKQLKNNFQIFKDPEKKLFLDEQEFVFYKTYNTSAGNALHENWEKTYDMMCDDISKLDFDIALLGCGGYGLPLCNYIHEKLDKSVIYIGGGLQLLFGVMGARWENVPMWKDIIKENQTKFIRPSKEEQIENKERVEGGCFW
tara:strand:+ start:2575 stop:3462 length:888 start_codon:yes stop_codon:yes gene_type:complete